MSVSFPSPRKLFRSFRDHGSKWEAHNLGAGIFLNTPGSNGRLNIFALEAPFEDPRGHGGKWVDYILCPASFLGAEKGHGSKRMTQYLGTESFLDTPK